MNDNQMRVYMSFPINICMLYVPLQYIIQLNTKH